MNILDMKFFDNDAGKETTVRSYFKKLLMTLWREGEEFRGKAPFGNSGWQYYLYAELIKQGIVKGTLDEYGYVEELDKEAADNLICGVIMSMQ